MPAAESGSHQQTGLPPAKEGKEKKEKPKSKTAQQVRVQPSQGTRSSVCSIRLKFLFCFLIVAFMLALFGFLKTATHLTHIQSGRQNLLQVVCPSAWHPGGARLLSSSHSALRAVSVSSRGGGVGGDRACG